MAMAGLGVGAVLFVWAIGALLGGNDVPSVRGAANERPNGVPLTSSAPSSNPPASGRLQAPGSTSASASTLSTQASATQKTSPPTTTTVTTTPGPPKACPDSVLQVTVTTSHPAYQVGDQPVLTLHIANTGAVPCTRNVSRQLRSTEVVAANGKTVLWSSSYCYTVSTNEIRTLQPQQSLDYSVTWAGRTAAPGCPANRTVVPAGKYELIGKLGTLTGKPTPLTLT
jgi:hypothetical protein